MRLSTFSGIVIALSSVACPLAAQNHDKAMFRNSEPGFYQNSILRDDRELNSKVDTAAAKRNFIADQSGLDLPNKIDFYKNQFWHNAPLSQGNTGTCWCFSTTSFLESEAYRLHKVQVKVSEIYTVYWEYVEKARRYIQERGNSLFDEGSEANAVTRMWKKYGVVPAESYTGLLNGRRYHNHEVMVAEMRNYLESLKSTSAWDEERALTTIKSIMNHYMGVPPTEVTVNGKTMTPAEYLKNVVQVIPDDYVSILSYEQEPFYKQVEYKVPDNWWHSTDYYNVPLDVFMSALKNAIRNGYSMSIGGDVSEAGLDRKTQCAIIPDFDIPSANINDDARQFRFSNNTTTDDHGMHVVSYYVKNGKDWYLIKDSSAGSRNNDPNAREFGYYFFSEDYVKLKMMDFMVHKDAVKEILQKKIQ
jgi:bleomycin hydrolase